MVADAVQILGFPLFVEGALSPLDDVLDFIAAVALVRLLGWHWEFLPSLIAELVPGVDLIPFWTLAVSHLLRALDTFKAQGIEFVSLSEQVDTGTPTGKMIFTVLGAVAELERSLISERIRAGLRHAKSKGKRLGRPRVVVDHEDIVSLRAMGLGWKRIAAQLGVGVGTVLRAAQNGR